jgi:hypothetical protein
VEELEAKTADLEALQLMSEEMEETVTQLNKTLQGQIGPCSLASAGPCLTWCGGSVERC